LSSPLRKRGDSWGCPSNSRTWSKRLLSESAWAGHAVRWKRRGMERSRSRDETMEGPRYAAGDVRSRFGGLLEASCASEGPVGPSLRSDWTGQRQRGRRASTLAAYLTCHGLRKG